MKGIKKVLSIVLAIMMAISIVPITASAATSGTCGDNLTWNFDESTGTLTISGTGAMYESFYFTGPPWVRYANNIKTVVTNHGVTTVGKYAFYSFKNLTSVTLGNSVTTIGDYALASCASLTNITIPNSVTSIGGSAFYSCDSLTSITIPDSVTTIGDYAFGDCTNLTSVTLGNSVTTIGNLSFVRCDKITSITVDINNKCYSNDEYGVLFNKDKTTLIQYPIGNTRKTYTIPDSVTTIGNYAFHSCDSLTSITIPDSVTLIGYCAFEYCDNLNDVYYSGTATQWNEISIDNYNESLTNATIHYNSTSSVISDCEVGDVVEFGLYPQSRVIDENILALLNALELDWTSYGYYSGTGSTNVGQMTSGDYMKYADVTYNGERYRAVEFTEYRPGTSSAGYICQYVNGYYTNTVYWFKFEPLQWRVLDPDEGFMLCESIIDSQPYNNTIYKSGSYYYQDTSCTNYANDYATSSIRDWLNDDFYHTAFTDVEKAKIQNSTQDNSCCNSNYPEYDSDTTNDKIFLLSYDEVISSDYGFSSTSDYDINRRAQGTDYAKARGLWVDNSSSSEYHGNSFWWLRSPNGDSDDACGVSYNGYTGSYYCRVNRADGGVRPALMLNSSTEVYKPDSNNDTLSPKIEILTDETSLQEYVGANIEIPIVYTSNSYNTSSLNIYSLYPDIVSIDSIEHNAGDYVCKANESKAVIKVKLKSAGSSMIVIDSVDGASNFVTVTAISPLGDEFDDCIIDGRKFEHNLDYYAENLDSSSYDTTLANMMAALSAAAYSVNNIKEAYSALGFTGVYGPYEYETTNPNRCGYSITLKDSFYGDDVICLISIRGSVTVSDWIGDFNIVTNPFNDKHLGFANPAHDIYNKIEDILLSQISSDNVKYFITGHSRGAAVANLLAVELMENGISEENVYNYNFACPDVACKSSFPTYTNIFNLCNRADIVPLLPGPICSSLTTPGTSWGKYGKTYWFTKEAENSENIFDNHDSKLYLKFFDQRLSPLDWPYDAEDKKWDESYWNSGWITKIMCPVDVIITDESGNKIASVINGETNYYNSSFGDVIIFTDGDKKIIYINGENDFDVELLGTDTGIMTYSVEKCNLASGEIYESKTYSDVTLEVGKTMYSPVSEADITNDIQLFVTEEKDGERVYTNIINEDGTEEKYYNYTFSIQNPSRTEIRNKDGIILHANVEGNSPAGSYVRWESGNGNFDTSADGSNLKIIAKNKGYTTFTAILCDADGNELARDSVEMYSKSGFFDKIGGFFRSLFGTTKIYDN